jgi:hypothetical protein
MRLLAAPLVRKPLHQNQIQTVPKGVLRRNPARVERPIRAPGAEAFIPTSFNNAERIPRGSSNVVNPSNNDAIFNASLAANAKAAQEVAALNALKTAAQSAAQAVRAPANLNADITTNPSAPNFTNVSQAPPAPSAENSPKSGKIAIGN